MGGPANFRALGSGEVVARIAQRYEQQSSPEVSDPLKLLFLPAI